MLCSMWDLPGPGLEPVSPALAGGFLTTVPPGKPTVGDFTNDCLSINRRLPTLPLLLSLSCPGQLLAALLSLGRVGTRS